MSRKEVVLLVSRAFGLLLTTWALAEVTYLPDRLFALFHHLSLGSSSATNDFWIRYYLILTVSTLVRVIAMFLVAILFWRCGPSVEALFSPQQDEQENLNSNS